ncbi:hypothetical protein OF83DRAFT_1113092 [Amylostereum chailletii]|nr:hypothetical protein OF83DRAFT_1113092 [Amylostereum chailletii]
MFNLTARTAFRAVCAKLSPAGPSLHRAFSTSHSAFVEYVPALAPTSLDSRPAAWNTLSRVRVAGDSRKSEPEPIQNFSQTPQEIWAERSDRLTKSLPLPKNAYAGRSIVVRGGNVAEALGNLTTVLRRNRVFVELRATERHEKKGEKRRRLSSQRWRRQFAHEVRKKVALVKAIRARGA